MTDDLVLWYLWWDVVWYGDVAQVTVSDAAVVSNLVQQGWCIEIQESAQSVGSVQLRPAGEDFQTTATSAISSRLQMTEVF